MVGIKNQRLRCKLTAITMKKRRFQEYGFHCLLNPQVEGSSCLYQKLDKIENTFNSVIIPLMWLEIGKKEIRD